MRLTTIQFLVLLFVGVIASWLWVALSGLWAVYNLPFVVWGLGAGLAINVVQSVLLLLFALISGILFAALLKLAFRRTFLVATAVFTSGFLGAFVISGAFAAGGLAFLASFGALWLFIMFFALAVLAFGYRRHA